MRTPSLFYASRPSIILGINPLLIFTVFAGFGYARNEIRRFEKDAATAILAQLQGDDREVAVRTKPEGPFGPLFADVAEVKISALNFSTEGLPLFTDPDRPKTGKVRNLKLDLKDFYLRGLRVDSLTATIHNCRFDRDLALRKREFLLSRSGEGPGSVVVSEEALEPFIVKKVREIKRVRVRLEKGKAWIEGYGEFLIAKSDFLVVADLQIEDGQRVNLANARVILGFQKADDLAKKVLLDALNPVVDLNKDLDLMGAFRLESLKLENGKMIATGVSKIPERPN